jgi:hypothetical protein
MLPNNLESSLSLRFVAGRLPLRPGRIADSISENRLLALLLPTGPPSLLPALSAGSPFRDPITNAPKTAAAQQL